MQEVLVAATPPVVAALIAALGFWLRRRSHANKVQQSLDEARANISMITSWISAHKDLDPAGEDSQALRQALKDLEKVYLDFSAAKRATEAEATKSNAISLVRTILLLDRRASSAVGRTLQVLYYVSLAWVLLWIAAAFLFGLGMAFSNPTGTLGEQLAFSFGITLLCLAIGLAPALLLFLIVRMSAADDPSGAGAPASGSAPPPTGRPGTDSWPQS